MSKRSDFALDSPRNALRETLVLAKEDQSRIVPVVGAGVSISLGLPKWGDLIDRLSHVAGIKTPNGRPELAVKRLKQQMGDSAYWKAIQNELSLPSDFTNLTLQALAQTAAKLVVTTNLDFAIENAFLLAGKPLHPRCILTSAREELNLIGSESCSPQLLKFHGTLDRPWTWIMTSEDYDSMYAENSASQEVVRQRLGIPLFLGFSLTDQDINHCLRLAKSWRRRSYAVLESSKAKLRADELSELGVIPIPFANFDQVPEIIDEIFSCTPPRAEITIQWDDTQEKEVRVGAACFKWSNESPELLNECISVLRNAFDVRPMRSYVDNASRRDSGQKKNYLNDFVRWMESDPVHPATVPSVLAMRQYQDILLTSLLPHVLRVAKRGHFEVLSTLYESCQEVKRARLKRWFLKALDEKNFTYSGIRALAKVLAMNLDHPAQTIPPVTRRIGRLFVCRYPLTQYQVGLLIRDDRLIRERSIRPYTLTQWTDVDRVIQQLNGTTDERWRLPTKDEWTTFSHCGEEMWPWGKESPVFQKHGQLRFLEKNKPDGTVEVGCFPNGQSAEGLDDLIGNVYELLAPGHPDRLAGGAWTTNVRLQQPIKDFRSFKKIGRGAGNVGLRLVHDA